MSEKIAKTNAVRMLDKAKMGYDTYSYNATDGKIDGISVAQKLGEDKDIVFKTLVCQGASKLYFVFIIPVEKELDLKKAAKSVGEKNVAMIPVADIVKITGYVRGGCSPLGMKKLFQTVIDDSAQSKERIIVSAGKIGQQIKLKPEDLKTVVKGSFEHLTI